MQREKLELKIIETLMTSASGMLFHKMTEELGLHVPLNVISSMLKDGKLERNSGIVVEFKLSRRERKIQSFCQRFKKEHKKRGYMARVLRDWEEFSESFDKN